ncbi:MAG TPA: DUF2270 domain-containing protein [Pyrinomonadaceae bacterium]|jgi:uncharacterized membrane protein
MKTDLRERGTGQLKGGERGASGRLRPQTSPLEELERTVVPNVERPAAAGGERQGAGATATVATPTARRASPAEFNTAMVHLYRGEVQRSNTWRNRLDTTTNWAVITAGATLSFAFGSAANPHFVIIINSILVAFFLFMEARRYRYYEIWSSRVRVLETGFFSQLLTPEAATNQGWAEHLSSDLITPHFTISEWEAVGRRLRRNYLWIFVLLALSWNLKVYLHPQPARDFDEFIARAAVGVLPGSVVFIFGVVFNVALLVFAVATLRLREATGEVLPEHQFNWRTISRVTGLSRVAAGTRRVNLRRIKRARQRVRTGGATGEFKRIHLSQTPDKEPVAK